MSDTTPGNEAVLVERRAHVMIITLNRPEVRNAVNLSVHLGVGLALERAEHDPEVRCVIITGAGEHAFCAGLDLKALARGEPRRPDDPVQAAWGFAGFIEHPISKPIIAAVNGTAYGGGTEIALACDMVVAVDTARFGLPEVKRGIIAGAGGTIRLIHQLPRKVAMELLLTGDPLSAQRALELGFINAVVPKEQLMEAALALAARVVAAAPLSVQASKRVALGIEDGRIPREDEAWRLSKAEALKLMQSEDSKEGPRAFAEKRAPLWKAR